jgi:hypothetical protein
MARDRIKEREAVRLMIEICCVYVWKGNWTVIVGKCPNECIGCVKKSLFYKQKGRVSGVSCGSIAVASATVLKPDRGVKRGNHPAAVTVSCTKKAREGHARQESVAHCVLSMHTLPYKI